MRLIRFTDDKGSIHVGRERERGMAEPHHDVFGLLSGCAALPHDLTAREALETGRAFRPTGEILRIVRRLAPIKPADILCAGRNYRSTVNPDSTKQPLELFLKPTTAVIGPDDPITLPRSLDGQSHVHAEGELAVVIGSRMRNVPQDDVLDHVLGVTAANDLTDRRWQMASGPPLWMRGKGFDGFCPLGPAILTAIDAGRLRSARTATRINGEVIRDGSTAEMVRSVVDLLVEISSMMTILPGTVLLTGAPDVREERENLDRALRDGDTVEVDVENVGVLRNPVRAP